MHRPDSGRRPGWRGRRQAFRAPAYPTEGTSCQNRSHRSCRRIVAAGNRLAQLLRGETGSSDGSRAEPMVQDSSCFALVVLVVAVPIAFIVGSHAPGTAAVGDCMVGQTANALTIVPRTDPWSSATESERFGLALGLSEPWRVVRNEFDPGCGPARPIPVPVPVPGPRPQRAVPVPRAGLQAPFVPGARDRGQDVASPGFRSAQSVPARPNATRAV